MVISYIAHNKTTVTACFVYYHMTHILNKSQSEEAHSWPRFDGWRGRRWRCVGEGRGHGGGDRRGSGPHLIVHMGGPPQGAGGRGDMGLHVVRGLRERLIGSIRGKPTAYGPVQGSRGRAVEIPRFPLEPVGG